MSRVCHDLSMTHLIIVYREIVKVKHVRPGTRETSQRSIRDSDVAHNSNHTAAEGALQPMRIALVSLTPYPQSALTMTNLDLPRQEKIPIERLQPGVRADLVGAFQ